MGERVPQTLANHVRFDPMYHYSTLPLAVFLLVWSIAHLVRHPTHEAIAWVVAAVVIFLLVGLVRSYALKVQDRVIRLEERLRLSALLPEPWRARISELSEQQLIALRFAADEEIPSLVEKTIRENLDPKAIKKAINNWRPDYWRV